MIWIPFYVYWFIKKGERNMANNMRKMYTEKQISDIAKSSVSGGTQLYQHEIPHSASHTIYLITTSNKEIEDYDEVIDYINHQNNDGLLINAFIWFDGDDYLTQIISVTSYQELVVMDDTGALLRLDLSSWVFQRDDVTKL